MTLVAPSKAQDLRAVVHYGDTVFVTPWADAGPCRTVEAQATRVDDTTLYAVESHATPAGARYRTPPYGFLAIPLGDIASLRVRPRPTEDETPYGLSQNVFDTPVHGKGSLAAPLALVALDLVVIAVQVPYYGLRYTYKVVERRVSGTPPAEAAPACLRTAR